MNKSKVTLLVSQSVQLSVKGEKAKIRWSSSNKKVAKVSSKGKVTGKKVGTATIKAKAGQKTYTCKVTVKAGLNKKNVDLKIGEQTTVKLCGSKIKNVKSSNQNVATIDKKGVIKAVGAGESTLTITGKNRKKYKCKVRVTKQEEPAKPVAKAYYEVKFDSTGGNAIPTQTVKAGEKASVPVIPSRNGYIFDHWDLNGAAFDFSTPINSDIILKAIWGSGSQKWDNASEVKQVISATIAPGVETEKQVVSSLQDRGFPDAIYYDYSIDGVYCNEAEASGSSSTKRPMYYTFYVSSNGDVWTVYSIDSKVFAYPASYNLESSVAVLVSETNEIISYDNKTNKYFVTVPNNNEIAVKIVKKIDAATLDTLTNDVLSKM